MSSFDWRKNVEDYIKDGLIITATTTRIFFALKAANVKPPKASLDVMDILKLHGRTCGGVLARLSSLQEMDQQVKDNTKTTNLLAYFSMVKILPGLLTVKCATAPSRMNTRHVRSSSLLSATFSI